MGAELTLQQMRDAIAKLSKQASLVLLLGWYHAARAANAADLKIEEMKIAPATDLHPGDRGYQWSVTWMRAKTSAKVGPYTTHSWISTEIFQMLTTAMEGRQSGHIVPKGEIPAVLKQVRESLPPGYDLRSMRRGSLTALAKAGVPLDTVMTFSGHTTVKSLLRYLRRGMHAGDRINRGLAAARLALNN